MRRCRRRLLYRVVASLLGLVGALLCLIGPPLPGQAQDLRTLQVWPDRSIGVTSGLLETPAVEPAAQVFPFGVTRISAGDVVYARTYLHFPLDVFPPGTEILRAALYVYVDSGSGAGETTVGAYRVLEPWREGDWGGDPAAWPALLTSPIAVTVARLDLMTPTLPASTPVPAAAPAVTSTPTSTAAGTSALSSRPAGHGLVQQATMVAIEPPGSQMDVGAITTVHIRIENVTDLYAAGVYLTFDPALLEVVDDDPTTDGVQVEPGDLLGPGFTDENIVYQAEGEIDFFQMAADEPVSGSGVLATITFRGKEVGVSALEFDAVFLEDYDGEPIAADFRGGSVTVTGQGSPLPTPPTSPLPTPTSLPGTPAPRATPAATSAPTPATPAPPLPTPTPYSPFTAPVVALGPVTGTWLTWDVTALMRAWLAGEVPDDGLALAPAPEPYADPDTAGDLLVARQLTVDDPDTRPYIIVGFEVNPVTPAPASVLPSAGSPVGWGAAGWLLVGAALLILGLTMRRR
jgi:hypothetical protein